MVPNAEFVFTPCAFGLKLVFGFARFTRLSELNASPRTSGLKRSKIGKVRNKERSSRAKPGPRVEGRVRGALPIVYGAGLLIEPVTESGVPVW